VKGTIHKIGWCLFNCDCRSKYVDQHYETRKSGRNTANSGKIDIYDIAFEKTSIYLFLNLQQKKWFTVYIQHHKNFHQHEQREGYRHNQRVGSPVHLQQHTPAGEHQAEIALDRQ
jgi:hypothetical protein